MWSNSFIKIIVFNIWSTDSYLFCLLGYFIQICVALTSTSTKSISSYFCRNSHLNVNINISKISNLNYNISKENLTTSLLSWIIFLSPCLRTNFVKWCSASCNGSGTSRELFHTFTFYLTKYTLSVPALIYSVVFLYYYHFCLFWQSANKALAQNS